MLAAWYWHNTFTTIIFLLIAPDTVKGTCHWAHETEINKKEDLKGVF